MNHLQSKIIYTQQGDEFEIHFTPKGFTLFQVIAPNEAKHLGGHYKTVGDLVNAMAHFALFSGEEAVSLRQIRATLKEIKQTLTDHLKQGDAWS